MVQRVPLDELPTGDQMRSIEELKSFIEACKEFDGGMCTEPDGKCVPVYKAKMEALKELDDATRLAQYVKTL